MDAESTFGGSSAEIRGRCENLVTRRSRFRIKRNTALISFSDVENNLSLNVSMI